MRPDIVVIGGGTVGAAVAYGLAKQREKVLLLDGDDGDLRAARANFGLVWLQGKGLGMPAYQALTRDSIVRWGGFRDTLQNESGVDLCYRQDGGLAFCFGEEAFEKRRLELMRLHNQFGEGEPDWEMLDRSSLERLVPKVEFGRAISGASLGHYDGHCNPLRLLAALHGAVLRHGGSIRHKARVDRIEPAGSDFRLSLEGETFVAPRIVIAAGLGSPALARQVGLEVPVRPERGQVLVTERLAPFLPLPASGLRQTEEGTVMIGATKDHSGFDVSTTTQAAAWLSRKTVDIVPALANVRLVRQWAGLRIMTPDGYPIYAQSESHPGAFVALCHSGVTLAAFHAEALVAAVAAGSLPDAFSPFHQSRFDVPQAA
ncbi:FAD-binding oxidoreductase [Bosea sp. F3-2]|uniref:NAD(P)/FAD-dependent oxidoreductase n=1 Tax=Bosea sp. F3-2 TaxID=2599640 RepID=UPI0011EC2F2F|nr:FAD-dependent oxidoreductase [Bosea sp. F3-2]QEL23802.1 FAD-binding oxidoreductase [Bosea sp. F3-2]